MTPNPTLAGHKLLVILQYAPDEPFLSRLKTNYPDLEITWHNPYHADGGNGGKANPLPEGLFKDVTILCTWNFIPTPEEAPKLKVVQLTSAGANHCFKDEIYKDPGVKFLTTNGTHPPQITEWVFATYLSFQHRIPRFLDAQKECEWIPQSLDVKDCVSQRIGILGYGAIGRHCARVAKAFGMDVIVYTMREKPTPESKKDDSYNVPNTGDPDGLIPSAWYSGTSKESLNHFLAQDLDLLVICLPLTSSTTNLIAKEQFQILAKKKTFISNIARGPIINTTDFMEALENGLIRGAAVDVTDPEPLPKEHPLWKSPNIFISPHVSWHSSGHRERLLGVLELNLGRLSEGKEFVNLVDKELGF